METDRKDILAIDIGGTFIKYGIIGEDFSIRKTWKKKTQCFHDRKAFFDWLCEGLDGKDFACAGVSSPGLVDQTGTVRTQSAASVADLFRSCIPEELEKRLQIPSAAINDAKAAGLCEVRLGNARGTKSSGCLIIGTGVGGCICLGDEVVFGADGFAGEYHYVPFFDEKTGTLLKLGRQCSSQGLVNLYNREYPEDPVTFGREVTEKYQAGEEKAAKVMDKWFLLLAADVITMEVTWNPEVICIGGGISEEDWFMERLKKVVREVSDPYFHYDAPISTELRPCKFRNGSNLIGASLCALQKLDAGKNTKLN